MEQTLISDNTEYQDLFNTGLDTINSLNIAINDLIIFKDYSYYQIKQYLLDKGIFDEEGIPRRSEAIKFLIDFYYVYHYDI